MAKTPSAPLSPATRLVTGGRRPEWTGTADQPGSVVSPPVYRASTHLYPDTAALKTGRVMAKDEDLCLHCGLCAERCPTGAWDMQKFLLNAPKTGYACHK